MCIWNLWVICQEEGAAARHRQKRLTYDSRKESILTKKDILLSIQVTAIYEIWKAVELHVSKL